VNLTTHPLLVSRSRMHGAILPSTNTSSWRGAQLSTGTTLPLQPYLGSRGSSVSVVTELRGGRSGFPPGAGIFSFRSRVQTVLGAHTASSPMGTGGSILRCKRPGHEADHLPQSSIEFKNAWSYASFLPYVFMTCC